MATIEASAGMNVNLKDMLLPMRLSLSSMFMISFKCLRINFKCCWFGGSAAVSDVLATSCFVNASSCLEALISKNCAYIILLLVDGFSILSRRSTFLEQNTTFVTDLRNIMV